MLRAPEEVAAADHHRDLHSSQASLGNLPGDGLDNLGVDAEPAGAGEGLAAHLEHNPGVLVAVARDPAFRREARRSARVRRLRKFGGGSQFQRSGGAALTCRARSGCPCHRPRRRSLHHHPWRAHAPRTASRLSTGAAHGRSATRDTARAGAHFSPHVLAPDIASRRNRRPWREEGRSPSLQRVAGLVTLG